MCWNAAVLPKCRPNVFYVLSQLLGSVLVPANKIITIVFYLFMTQCSAVVYCLVFCIGTCVPVHEDRTVLYHDVLYVFAASS